MTPTMPPVVQHRPPSTHSPAARKSAAVPTPDPKPEAASFRRELVRQRKEKAEKAGQREPTQATKASARAARAQKARKTRANGGKPQADSSEKTRQAEGAAATAPESLPPQDLTESGATDPLDNDVEEKHSAAAVGADKTDAVSMVGVAAAPQAAVPSAAAPPASEGEAGPMPQGVSALTASAVDAEAISAQGAATELPGESPVDSELVATDEPPGAETAPTPDSEARPAASAAANSQPGAGAFGQALAGASGPSAAEGSADGQQSSGDQGAGDGSGTNAAWMQELEAEAGAFSEAMSPDDPADAPHASRAGTADAIQSPALDLSARPAAPAGAHGAFAAPAADAMPPEARFAAANHENIVKGMHAEVMPNGGTMRIRLDPPQLGALQVTVHVRDGVVTAAFETSNDEATRLLGHSLNQLKAVLESHGVGVDKLQVQQAPRDEHANTSRDDGSGSRHQGQTPYEQEQAARQEQQRKEMLRKMWRRLSGGADPLDVTV